MKALHEAGVPITINTDDPTFFSTTLAEEFKHLSNMGISDQDLIELMKNGFRYAFLPPEEIQSYLKISTAPGLSINQLRQLEAIRGCRRRSVREPRLQCRVSLLPRRRFGVLLVSRPARRELRTTERA